MNNKSKVRVLEGVERVHEGKEQNSMIFLRDTGWFLYMVATFFRGIQAKKNTHMDTKKWLKILERSLKRGRH